MSAVGRPKRDQGWARLVGLWIRQKRQEVLGMSQGELSEYVNVTRTTVNKWESGRVSAPIPKAVAVHELAKLYKGGLRDKDKLKESLNKLTALDIDGLVAELARTAAKKPEA